MHPELEKALRELRANYPENGYCPGMWSNHPLPKALAAIDAYLPEPSFGDRVLEHLPEGWKMAQKAWDTGRWSVWKDEKRKMGQRPTPSFYIVESDDPAAVAKALLLLSGEGE